MDNAPTADVDESDLIRRAREGSQTAWEALMHLHQEPVFRFAYLLLGDPAEAEDAAQETFIRAYQAFDRFELGRPLRPWLLSIAANLSRNRRRSIGRYLTALQRMYRSKAESDPKVAIEDLSDARWLATTLWKAVRELEPASQEIIYLRYFLELPVDETAQVLGVAEGTVKSRLHRALNRLKTIIHRDYPDLIPEAGLVLPE